MQRVKEVIVSFDFDGLIYATMDAVLIADDLIIRIDEDSILAERVIPTSRPHVYLRDNKYSVVFEHRVPNGYDLETLTTMTVPQFIKSLDLNKK